MDDRERRRDERRMAALRDAARHPTVAGRFHHAISDDPETLSGLSSELAAKRKVAIRLRRRIADGVFLYDRLLRPGHHDSGIDIIAVVPSGIWAIQVVYDIGSAIDARHAGVHLSRNLDTWFLNSRKGEDLLRSLDRQAGALEQALHDSDYSGIHAHKAVCFTDARLPRRDHGEVEGTQLTTPRQLVRLLRQGPRRLRHGDIALLALSVVHRLPRQRTGD